MQGGQQRTRSIVSSVAALRYRETRKTLQTWKVFTRLLALNASAFSYRPRERNCVPSLRLVVSLEDGPEDCREMVEVKNARLEICRPCNDNKGDQRPKDARSRPEQPLRGGAILPARCLLNEFLPKGFEFRGFHHGPILRAIPTAMEANGFFG